MLLFLWRSSIAQSRGASAASLALHAARIKWPRAYSESVNSTTFVALCWKREERTDRTRACSRFCHTRQGIFSLQESQSHVFDQCQRDLELFGLKNRTRLFPGFLRRLFHLSPQRFAFHTEPKCETRVWPHTCSLAVVDAVEKQQVVQNMERLSRCDMTACGTPDSTTCAASVDHLSKCCGDVYWIFKEGSFATCTGTVRIWNTVTKSHLTLSGGGRERLCHVQF